MNTLSSCGTTRGMILVHGPFDTAKLSVINPVEPIIRKGDILSIIVFSDNPNATRIYNQLLIVTGSTPNNLSSAGSSSSTSVVVPAHHLLLDIRWIWTEILSFRELGRLK